MVNKSVPQSVSRKRRGILTRKLFRDMRHSAMQFIAMMILCFLGTWVFAGLDANWRMLELSVNTYFEENNIADLWVKDSGFTKEDQLKVKHLLSVDEVICRTNLQAECPELGDSVEVNMIAYEGEMFINTPIIRSGEALDPGDNRGILVEEQFAQAQDLKLGDSITLRIQGEDISFTVKGTVISPEFIVTTNDVAPSPETYGFVLLNRSAVRYLPVTEMVIRISEGMTEAEAKSEIAQVLPSALILTQNTNTGTASAKSFSTMFRSLCYLFPVLVYAVATMIVVSTLTRMIENQRIQMGTLKALGFSRRKIRNHYLAYALVPSTAGSLLGLIVAQFTLPDAIWTMITHNSRMPYKLRPRISIYSWAAFAATIILSLFVCYLVYRKAADETTASLLRPKPPKNGSRILLERWSALWKRLSFNAKMVIRNIFRNKGRSFLSLVGVFCCNMLIVCSFSLQDSIPAFISNYYTRTHAYDLRVDLKSGYGGTLESYQNRMDAQLVEGIMERSITAVGPKGTRGCLLTVIPEGQQLICLGKGEHVIELPQNSACVSKKLCELLGLETGDSITIYLVGETDPITIPIEAYAYTSIGQGVFLSGDAWNTLRKGEFQVTSLLLKNPSDRLLHELDEMEAVDELKFPEAQNKQTLSIMDSTTTLFTIFSGAALFLAFIICYNMGLMNFTERTRDYATLKVLGYHQKEIRKIMMREQQIISIIATFLGIYPGMLLTEVILQLCEYEGMVFSTTFYVSSIVKACVISIVFAWAIEYLLTLKVKSIDMVEALKSVE